MVVVIMLVVMILILIFGGLAVMALTSKEKKDMRVTVHHNIKSHKEIIIKVAEARFTYEKSLAELNTLEARSEELKLSIDDNMSKLGFFQRLLVPMTK